MSNKSDLNKAAKKILKEVRFGNLSSRLSPEKFPDDTELVNDFNNMVESVLDREEMIKEYQKVTEGQAETLKRLFNMLNEGAITLSEDFIILRINVTQAKWFRKSKKNLIGKSIFDLLQDYTIRDYPSNTLRTNHLKFFEKDKKNYLLTFEIKKPMTFSVSIKRFLDKNGKTNYFIISKDITPDVNLQKLKDTFIAMLTHDLKVPILAEAKVLEILQKETFGQNSDFQKEAFANMAANNKDMMSLVTTLLDVYKLEDGVYELNKTNCNLLKLVKAEIEKLKYLAAENKCELKISTTKDLPEIFADENEISRVVKNVLTNAINFAPENTTVKVKIKAAKEKLYIDISDKGCGIEKKDLPHVFDRYFTTGKKYRKVGTGLGLYLSKKIMLLHDGDILVNSIPNKETTFTVVFPHGKVL